ncbi:MAG: universal stress protein [Actinomycetota bacterium]|nr:universal stress protein [Actinomycetota bacterium]
MNEDSKPENRGSVVVGVDGSAGAQDALRWALAEARLRNVPLRIVHAWMYGYTGVPSGALGYLAFSSRGLVSSDLQQAAEQLLDRATEKLIPAFEGVEVTRNVVEGTAAEVLIGAATDDDLLVVGSRGHGGFGGLLLGSVSQQCAHHAPCPVVIVHPPNAPETESESPI